MSHDSGAASAPADAASQSELANLNPAYFALVMATGIVGLACHLLETAPIGEGLLWLNACFYAALWVLYIARIVKYPQRVRADLLHHGRSVGFFTAIAATSVLGSQFLIVGQLQGIAVVLGIFALVLWVVLMYGIFTLLIVTPHKPPLSEGINGGWLVSVVAGQSVSVLGSQLAVDFPGHEQDMLLFSLCVWLGSGMLYIWIVSLIFYRYMFFELHPADLAPPYWINMGAVAISALAGTMLVSSAPYSPLLGELLPFLKGFTLFFWSTATWWIPMLLILGLWRHAYRRLPLHYDPLYWGAVFPLGMYAVCSYRLSIALDTSAFSEIAHAFAYIALGAWALTFYGLVTFIYGRLRAHRKF